MRKMYEIRNVNIERERKKRDRKKSEVKKIRLELHNRNMSHYLKTCPSCPLKYSTP